MTGVPLWVISIRPRVGQPDAAVSRKAVKFCVPLAASEGDNGVGGSNPPNRRGLFQMIYMQTWYGECRLRNLSRGRFDSPGLLQV